MSIAIPSEEGNTFRIIKILNILECCASTASSSPKSFDEGFVSDKEKGVEKKEDQKDVSSLPKRPVSSIPKREIKVSKLLTRSSKVHNFCSS